MEFQKFSARVVPSVRALSSLEVNRTLCEDVLSSVVESVNVQDSFNFSSVYFIDFNGADERIDHNNIYVLDGVSHLHRLSQTDMPLVKNRDLFRFLYDSNRSNIAFSKALLTNPWLNDIYTYPTHLMSEKVMGTRDVVAHFNASTLMKSVLNEVSDGFTPRGVWGLDYMFLWKKFNEVAEIYLNAGLSLTPLSEYVNSFNHNLKEQGVV